MYYVGVDWADDHHEVFVTDESAKKLDKFTIPHSAEGVHLLHDRLGRFPASREEIFIALERPKNLIVSALLNIGYRVYALNPRAIDRYHDRYRTSGARDDAFDARVRYSSQSSSFS